MPPHSTADRHAASLADRLILLLLFPVFSAIWLLGVSMGIAGEPLAEGRRPSLDAPFSFVNSNTFPLGSFASFSEKGFLFVFLLAPVFLHGIFKLKLEFCLEPLIFKEFTLTLPTPFVFPCVAYRIVLPSSAFAMSNVRSYSLHLSHLYFYGAGRFYQADHACSRYSPIHFPLYHSP